MSELILKYWPIILLVLQVSSMWVAWSLQQKFATKDFVGQCLAKSAEANAKEIVDIHAALSDLRINHSSLHEAVSKDTNHRLIKVEEQIRHMPKHEDLAHLHKRLDDITGKISEMSGQFRSSVHTLNLIHEHLMNQAHQGGKQK